MEGNQILKKPSDFLTEIKSIHVGEVVFIGKNDFRNSS